MTDKQHWQLEGGAAEFYERYLVPTVTSVWAADLVYRAGLRPGEAVLDIACGTGAVTRLLPARVGTGRVVGLDLNPSMLSVARSLHSAAKSIEWKEGSALSLTFDDSSFDVVLCQLGLQFFPDRSLALREMRRVLAPSGRVALSVYSAIEDTPAAYAFARALDQRLGPDASSIKRSEHALSDVTELDRLLTRAGFYQVTISRVVKRITFPSVLDYVRIQLIATPMATLLAKRNNMEREQMIEAIASDTKALLPSEAIADGQLLFPQVALVATALRAEVPRAL
jgi:ubiquinone/menaquinone biosynthesis C-methylase UbiE